MEWDRHAIKAEIHRRGQTLTGLARAAGAEPSVCRVALIRRCEKGEEIISRFLGIPRHVLWPHRYGTDSGTSRRHHATRRRSRRHHRASRPGKSNRRKVA